MSETESHADDNNNMNNDNNDRVKAKVVTEEATTCQVKPRAIPPLVFDFKKGFPSIFICCCTKNAKNTLLLPIILYQMVVGSSW